MIVSVPPLDRKPWPTLGPQVCAWIEEHLTFGPGDLVGQPARIDDEKRALIYRMYEVHPKGTKRAGRRRFRRVAISLRKGSAKTELAAWIAAVELHHEGPVRCAGWDKKGQPIGGPVTDPYIPMVAYTEEQSEELAYGALRVILEHSDVAADFDIGLERIMRADGYGKAEALATSPSARDGARTTWQHFDESHHMASARLKKAHRAMLANLPKRRLADAWSLETTTAPAPGEGSVAEDTMEYAHAVAEGRVRDSRLFFFHRQAAEDADLETLKGIRAAVREASGPVAEWSDLDGIVDQWRDPTADRNYLRRVWLNQLVRGSERAFDAARWAKLAKPELGIPDGAKVVLGFDGARYDDATGLVATDIVTGHQVVVGAWERPPDAAEGWEVPELDVNAAVEDAFHRWVVWRFYGDPPYWETTFAKWAGEHGEKVAIAWPTNRWPKMAYAVRAFVNAIANGELSHDGSAMYARHVANAHKREIRVKDDQGKPMWVIQKDRSNSPNKIDLAMAGILSWQARCDALGEGVDRPTPAAWDGHVTAFA